MITYRNPAALAEALKRAEAAHAKRTGQDKDWPSFYAAFMDGEQAWGTTRPVSGFTSDPELNAVLDSFPETPEMDAELGKDGVWATSERIGAARQHGATPDTDEELTEPGEDA